ncbi:MAG: ATP-binding cassette domain-containing protein [Sedimentisphaerales bacterium]|nr:ATP-binding cassette domain-containing protein [Sedimentisphaerales bacterium]
MNTTISNNNGFLLKVDDLKTYFPVKKGLMRRTVGYIKAVDGVSFAIKPALTFGLVGESGCGKTTVARSILRLLPVTSGKVIFDNTDILAADKKQLKDIRRHISLIFQDPFGSLNPRMTIGSIIGEPLKVHKKITGKNLAEQVCLILSKVGLSPDAINRYPHEFSGGQRQRIGIARALILQPKFVICDEPVSALDVSIQSQILNLLKDLQDEFSLTYLFIAHDLAVVQFSCDVVAVMYMGRIVEHAPANELFNNPLHPYTVALMSAIPRIKDPNRQRQQRLKGEVPDIINQPAGCPFYPRCPYAKDSCLSDNPPLVPVPERPEHLVACRHI